MRKRGQSLLEYSALIIILLGAFVAAQSYVKRGIQGRWKSSVDDMGDQYDPRSTCSSITYSVNSSSNSLVSVVDSPGGKYTSRVDNTISTENKVGNTQVGP
jgi:hypothetical protein